MSNDTTLLFLHGVGTGDQADLWKSRLAASLARLGYPELDSVRVIAPKYAHALKDWDEREELPGLTVKHPSGDAAKRNRRDFERRVGAVEYRLGRHDRGGSLPGGDALVDLALGHPAFAQARNYVQDRQIRAQVLNRILSKLPTSGRLVVIGHSLGSVIAADLVRRLPVEVEITGMVTIGSPLANAGFGVDNLREVLKEPPVNLSWWVNFWNWHDPVCGRRGVSSVFPWMMDLRVRTDLGPDVHSAANYLAADVVADAIGFALFGSRSKELETIDRGLDIPLDSTEQLAVLALRYGHLIKSQLGGDQRDRFEGALRQVQAAAVESIMKRNADASRGTPSAIARLAFDYSDAGASVPEPLPARHLTKDDAVVPLTVFAAENMIRPFEIAVPVNKRQNAMRELTAEMGLGSQFGADVFDAAKRAHEVLSGGRGVDWIKWGALGVGAAALAVATGGLVLAAGAGLAGAAAITSALAAFGPGGMLGGLLTAGSLVAAGGGGIAYGLASPGTSAETLETVVARQLAAEILRKQHRLDPDPAVWRNLAETEIEVRRAYERLDEFSDESAPSLKEMKRKIVALERALKYLREQNLEPGASDAAHAGAESVA
ncbi:hypothetical protein [Agromyces sp. ZXT2-3]|uniref:hypothetical protein n=1 Tax=Agromyces sp. ZXT2-3 TaxID=3461152 RepID=UPI004054C1D2